MTIREREDELYERWTDGGRAFVRDGVVDEQAYDRSDPKVLLVLKEVNDPGGDGWDLRKFLRKGGRSQTWTNVTRWLIGIRRLDEDLPWSQLETITADDRVAQLQSIAAVNLKKAPGGHTTDPEELAKAATDDKEFLRQQIGLYDADITIACGSVVASLLTDVLSLPHPSAWKTTRRGIRFHQGPGRRVIFAYSHPEARVQDGLLYYGIVDAAREVCL